MRALTWQVRRDVGVDRLAALSTAIGGGRLRRRTRCSGRTYAMFWEKEDGMVKTLLRP
ncbi:hypothetical protein ACIO87_09345 [Streptomyces sp. NPDC087218]|uniref:hypothetical protein n=1 Tax=Streptomyces sp. NPDC087218 TaxID=3365769 RepID=UPI0037F27E38